MIFETSTYKASMFSIQQVRFHGREYVLMQHMDMTLHKSEVKAVLRAEYQLLCQCDGFKHLMPMKRNWVSILFLVRKLLYNDHCVTFTHSPLEFYFNFKDSIFGQVQGFFKLMSGGRIIPHQHFLATLLLPCGKVDSKIQNSPGMTI